MDYVNHFSSHTGGCYAPLKVGMRGPVRWLSGKQPLLTEHPESNHGRRELAPQSHPVTSTYIVYTHTHTQNDHSHGHQEIPLKPGGGLSVLSLHGQVICVLSSLSIPPMDFVASPPPNWQELLTCLLS